MVIYFFVVRSGEHVKLQDGGESVLWNITGGLDYGLFSYLKGASFDFDFG